MSALFYGISLQCRLDIRSKTLLVTCYLVPLLFFALMGGIFTSINPVMKDTLIQAMTVMGVSMGALIGMPPSLVEIYGSDVKKAYKVNGVPLYFSLISVFISTFFHLMVMSVIIFLTAPVAFDAVLPSNILLYFISLAIFTAVSLSVGCVLGLAVKRQSKLTMLSQIVFLPSIMLSGIMFPVNLLPAALELIGKILPAAWGYLLMLDGGLRLENLLVPVIILIAAIIGSAALLKRQARG